VVSGVVQTALSAQRDLAVHEIVVTQLLARRFIFQWKVKGMNKIVALNGHKKELRATYPGLGFTGGNNYAGFIGER
jgi:hypothetical protein